MKTAILSILLAGLAGPQEDDLIARVLKDELDRSMKRLRMEKAAAPYFLAYTVRESQDFQVTATFGAVSQRGEGRRRTLAVDARAGDYSLDNTNFGEGGLDMLALMGRGGGGGESFTVDDDYDALRNAAWLATDRAYKGAVEGLEKKKAYLQANLVKDRPDDLSREEPFVLVGPAAKLELDRDRWTAAARRLSAVFREFPRVQTSLAMVMARARNRWFVNSEGFRNRSGETQMGLVLLAAAQADDGMRVSDYEAFVGRSEKDLPADAVMEKAARALAQRLTDLCAAPHAEEYRGPILLEGQAAAEFFAQTLAPNLGNAHEKIGQSNPMASMADNQLREKIGTRILPAFLSVIDDPSARDFGGAPLLGGFDVDDDGVKAQKITLVENGVLKAFCMSRIPTRQAKKSNGHSQGGVGRPTTIFIESGKKLGAGGLRTRLVELARDEGLKHVLVARRISNLASAALNPQSLVSVMMGRMMGGAEGVTLLPPVLLYRVSVADGREELVRGGRFGRLTLRVLRDIEATGDDAAAHPVVQGTEDVGSLVAPSVLLREIEVSKPGKETEKPPVLKNPFFEK